MTLIPLPDAASRVLEGRVILITGAAGGLGSAAAMACTRAGATVVVLGRKIPRLTRLYDALLAIGSEPFIYPLDMEGAGPDDYEALAERLHDGPGRLDGILHCAAEFRSLTPFEYTDPGHWALAIHINLTAPCWLSQACLPLMKRSDDAALVFVIDDLRRVGDAYWGGYGVSQFALNGLVGMLHAELRNSSVRVSGIRPGPMHTPLRERAYVEDPDATTCDPAIYADACVTLLSPAGKAHRGQVWAPVR